MNYAEFRFYEELNDFLPRYLRKISFKYPISSKRVGEMIETLGIPHTEVDLIIINGQSVDFNYLLQDKDRVAVYPLFESIDISRINQLRPEPLRVIKFIVDVHLGRLAKYLRICGFDTIYEDVQDDAIIARSLKERRIILTKDKGLLKNKRVTHGYWVRAIDPKKQLLEIVARFDLRTKIKFLIRCLLCNELLQTITKEHIKHLIPEKTTRYYDAFYICKHCNKIYWKGSHYNNMLQMIQSLNPE